MKKIYLLFVAVFAGVQFTHAQWTTSGSNIYNSNSGYVGIGTGNPTQALTVAGNILGTHLNAQGNIGISSNTDARIYMSNTTLGTGQNWNIISETNGAFELGIFGSNPFQTITANGNVGIGTTNPIAGLEVWNGAIRITGGYGKDYSTDGGYMAWNRSGGGGEMNFVNNIGGGSTGGFTFDNTTRGNAITRLMTISGNGNIGIGTTAPSQKLDVEGGSALINLDALSGSGGQLTISNNFGNQNGYVRLNLNNGGAVSWIQGIVTGPNTNTGSAMVFGVPSNTADGIERMRITNNGNLLIGQISQVNTGYKLDVAGSIRSSQVVVNTSGADFVFEPAYRLSSLSDLKRYIDRYHHLPEIASAKQMQAEGLDLGDNQVKLLQKIEELTLYLIEKDKKEKDQEERIKKLERLCSQWAKHKNRIKK